MTQVFIRIVYFCLLLNLISCASETSNVKDISPDLLLINGNIYTVDQKKPHVQAIAIKDSRITAIGNSDRLKKMADTGTKVIDLKGKTAIPGFIEGHGHFTGLGYSLIRLNFLNTKNWQEVLDMVAEKVKTAKPGEWIEGRGWHQEKWDKQPDQVADGYPTHQALSKLSPNNPIILRHASGHSAFANQKAMALAGITKESASPTGGRIIKDQSGNPSGVFEENAMDALYEALGEYRKTLTEEEKAAELLEAIEMAEQECLENGITSFQDAGSSFEEINAFRKLAETDELDLRLWVMIRRPYEETKSAIKGFPWINVRNNHLTVRAIKTQVDGALGAHGAWLLKPYADKPGFFGQNTTTVEEVANMAALCKEHNLQLCVHAIGDRANREVLDIMEKAQKDNRDLRWRIEHAQHVNESDIPRFGELGVIASMQGIHCTSDAPFVEKRLGKHRAGKESYAWRTFIDSGAKLANGTDAPVEDVSPIKSYYASVTRKREDGMAFFPEQKMTRKEGLASYTINNAYAGFEDTQKGSISVGKLGDITVLSQDILTVPDEQLLATEVLYTIVGGVVKYEKK